ncbi:DUF3810 domain-containing protein [Flavobacterium restrictum]|uniref:DUF3810 domain-containing protein n=1 Tax=Flavobacterium restrictum TaxID=2594428 RepID=A0A553E428_9FLAO|nr:DUF3810 domain-containing protein [Flavobacterium restrictum]TRX39786.1 DUF3810 domain-containing protein [Flavobacterium restrictum]
MQRKYILPIFLILQIITLKTVRFFPEYIEVFYSNRLYLFLSKTLRIVLGKIPFSVGDCIYFILIFLILKWFWNKRKTWKSEWKNNLLTILSLLSLFYFFFHLLWALNYYREPLFEKMKIERDYTDADLLIFTQKLIAKTNAIQKQLTQNDSLKVTFPYSQEKVFELNLKGYKTLAAEYAFFSYSHLSVKKSLFSLPLTYMGFGGYLNPFTNEAQVNYLGPMYSFPMTTNHEMAHQMGFASESECNFIGFLASVKNDDLYVQYSGYSLALRYCLGNWQARNPKKLKELLQTVHPGILKNYQESTAFWNQYQTPIETAFHVFYDHFLKANQQKDGLDSYSKYVNLMVNYYKNRAF